MKLGTWQFAGLFTLAILGANHVSGAEWMRYFTYYGSWGTIGLVLTIFLITYISSKLVRLIHSLQIRSVAELFQLIFGPIVSPVLTFLFYCITIGFSAFVLQDQVQQLFSLAGIAPVISLLVFLGILLFAVTISIQNVSKAALVGVILAIIYVLLFFIKQPHIQLPSFAYQFNLWWGVRALFFTSSHLLLSLVILIPAVARMSDVRLAARGVWISGSFFALLALLSHFVLLAFWHDVNATTHPFYVLSANLFFGGSSLFLAISAILCLLYITIWSEGFANLVSMRFDINQRPLQILFLASIAGISFIYALSFWFGLFTYLSAVYFGLFFLLFLIRHIWRTSAKK